jgi:hypothetical protein
MVDRQGRTALRVAQMYKARQTAKVIAESDLNCATFHAAIRTHNHAHVVNLLHKSHALVWAADYSGATSLHTAAAADSPAAIKLLIKAGAEPDGVDGHGRTALAIAAEKGNINAMELLLVKGAKPSAADNDGMAPLHYAAAARELLAAKLLILWGAGVNQKSHLGFTPLHRAAEAGGVALVKLLLKEGANPAAEVAGGGTALKIARDNDRTECALVLLTATKDVINLEVDDNAAHSKLLTGRGPEDRRKQQRRAKSASSKKPQQLPPPAMTSRSVETVHTGESRYQRAGQPLPNSQNTNTQNTGSQLPGTRLSPVHVKGGRGGARDEDDDAGDDYDDTAYTNGRNSSRSQMHRSGPVSGRPGGGRNLDDHDDTSSRASSRPQTAPANGGWARRELPARSASALGQQQQQQQNHQQQPHNRNNGDAKHAGGAAGERSGQPRPPQAPPKHARPPRPPSAYATVMSLIPKEQPAASPPQRSQSQMGYHRQGSAQGGSTGQGGIAHKQSLQPLSTRDFKKVLDDLRLQALMHT